MTVTTPVDEAAVEAFVGLENAGLLSLAGPNAEGRVAAEIITDAYAKHRPPEFDAFDRKHYPSFDAPVAEAVERLFRHWSNTPDHTLFGIERVTQLIKDVFREYDLRHKYYGSCVGQTPEMLMAISHRHSLTAEREMWEKVADAASKLSKRLDIRTKKCCYGGQEGHCRECLWDQDVRTIYTTALAEAEAMNNKTPTETKGSNHGQPRDRTANC